MFVVNMQEELLIGQAAFRVIWGESRQLNTKVSRATTTNYVQRLKESLQRHKILEQMGRIHAKYKKPGKKLRQALAKLNKETEQLMRNTEKKCRWINLGRVPFSPEAALWITRMQVIVEIPPRTHKE